MLRKEARRTELMIIDVIGAFLAGCLAYIFDHGTSTLLSDFWNTIGFIAVTALLYFIGFLLWKTNNSFLRPVASDDVWHCIAGAATGAILTALWTYVNYSNTNFDEHDTILQFVLAILSLRTSRYLIKIHHHYYGRRSDNNGFYGLSDMALLNMELSQLLSRDTIHVDEKVIAREIENKCVMVTGGAGSIGSSLVRKLACCNPGYIVVVDQAETPLHDLEMELKRDYPDLKFATILCSVCNRMLMDNVFKNYRPDIIFHAAAYKHVSMMQQNPVECILNNVDGTINMASLAIKYNSTKFILISSDKAVNPTGIMGCSKRICEIYCRSLSVSAANTSHCGFITTRFGNVLGSNGSVVPIFREQIRRGGPVTLTHPNVIRYFMLVDEACTLVLEASAIGKNGEIFVFDMGRPVRILDLAKKMISISRRNDIKIEYIGLQPGEKLSEEILADKEQCDSTLNEKLWIAKEKVIPFETVESAIESLMNYATKNDTDGILKVMHELVPEFRER